MGGKRAGLEAIGLKFWYKEIVVVIRQDSRDFQDFFVCIFNFRKKLKIPNSLREGGKPVFTAKDVDK